MNKPTKATPSKGKGVVDVEAHLEPHKENISLDESQEFRRLIWKREFNIMDKLGQTPPKISILSLLLSSKAHRAALMKVLNAAHVMQDIIVDQFDEAIKNIIAIN